MPVGQRCRGECIRLGCDFDRDACGLVDGLWWLDGLVLSGEANEFAPTVGAGSWRDGGARCEVGNLMSVGQRCRGECIRLGCDFERDVGWLMARSGLMGWY